jgi:MFS family permease
VSSQRTGSAGPGPERTHPTREDEPRFTREPGGEAPEREPRREAGPADLRGPRRRAFLAAGLGWALDGFDWTMYAFAITAIVASLGVSVADASFVVTSALIASAVGGVLGGVLADRFGRVRVLTWVILAYSVFTALTATSQNLTQLFVWRTLHGFAFGAEWAVGAALLAEYAVPAHRGRTMGWLQSMYAVGWAFSTAAYLISFSVLDDGLAWRVLFLAGIIPALAAFVIRRRTRDRVAGPTGRAKISLPLLFARGQRRTTIIATLLGVGDQGIYYSVFIFLPLFLKQERGLSVIGTATYTWVAIVGSFIGYVSAGYIHDALGRRPGFSVFFVGSAASIALFVLAPVESTSLGLVVTFFLGFFASGQAAGMGAYLAELFPTKMRGAGQGFAYNVGRGLAAGAPGAVGAATAAIGLGSAILVVGAVASALALVSVWLLPETRGREIVEREPQRERELTALA